MRRLRSRMEAEEEALNEALGTRADVEFDSLLRLRNPAELLSITHNHRTITDGDDLEMKREVDASPALGTNQIAPSVIVENEGVCPNLVTKVKWDLRRDVGK